MLELTAPNYDVYIIGEGLNKTWYSIDGGEKNFTINDIVGTICNTTGLINQSSWDEYGDGLVSINFYANDTYSNETIFVRTVYKDLLTPVITINMPIFNQTINAIAPSFNLTIVEANINTTWYSLDGGLTNKTFSGFTGTIDQTLWNLTPNGTVTITFYANDTIGRVNLTSIVVVKYIALDDPPESPPDLMIVFVIVSISATGIASLVIISLLRKKKKVEIPKPSSNFAEKVRETLEGKNK